MAIYSSHILTVAFLLVPLCSFTTASTRRHMPKDNGGEKSVKSQFRSLRRRPSRLHHQVKDLPWWKLTKLQPSSTNGRTFIGSTSDTSAAPIASTTSSPAVHLTSAPTVSPSKSPSEMPTLAPILNPTDGPTKKTSSAPTKSPTNLPSGSPSVSPTKVESMNYSLKDEALSMLSNTMFLSVFLGVYVLFAGAFAIRWLWSR